MGGDEFVYFVEYALFRFCSHKIQQEDTYPTLLEEHCLQKLSRKFVSLFQRKQRYRKQIDVEFSMGISIKRGLKNVMFYVRSCH